MEGPHGPIPYPSAQLCYQQPSSQGPSQSAFSDLSTRLHTHIIKPVIPRTLEERDESFTVEGSPLERAKTAITHDAHGALWDDDGEGEEAVSSRLQQHVRQSGHAHTPPNTQESEEDNEYPVDMDLDSGASYDPFEEDEYDRGGDAHWEYDGLFTQIPFTQSPTDFEE